MTKLYLEIVHSLREWHDIVVVSNPVEINLYETKRLLRFVTDDEGNSETWLEDEPSGITRNLTKEEHSPEKFFFLLSLRSSSLTNFHSPFLFFI
jgi:hypothetical protein